MATARHSIALRRPLESTERTAENIGAAWWRELLWVAAAAVVGFASTAVLAGWLELPRPWLVLIYTAVTVPLFIAYVRRSRIDLGAFLLCHWRWGILGAVVAGVILVMGVQNQDGSPRPDGVRLAWDVFWLGVVYGLVDALLLSVLPVLATWRAFSRRGWTDGWGGKVRGGWLAVAASLLVTAAYHLGYPEFQGSEVTDPLAGNAIVSLAYVLTNNPITAIGSHIAMHIAAVLHGAEGTVQLPPHY